MKYKQSLASAAVVLLLTLPFLMSEADADTEIPVPNEVWYCYGDQVTLQFDDYKGDTAVEWIVLCVQNDTIVRTVNASGQYFPGPTSEDGFDASTYDTLYATQNVMYNGKVTTDTSKIILLHETNKTFTVRIFQENGGTMISAQTLTSRTSVEQGSPFITMPTPIAPRDGVVFDGWYTSASGSETAFNPYLPITTDTDVYAKWASSSVTDTYTVSFVQASGLSFGVLGDVTVKAGSALSFTVTVNAGYTFDMATLKVAANGTVLAPTSTTPYTYTLSDITADQQVTVSGDQVYTVTYDLSHAHVTNTPVKTVAVNGPLKVQLSPDDYYGELAVTVTMGGTDVTAGVYADGTVNIAAVTGDVVITAAATASPAPSDNGTSVWLWVALALAVIALALAVAVLYLHHKH